MKRLPWPCLCLVLLVQGSKCEKDSFVPADQLPPATQTGANTFGCLVNGALCRPKGTTGTPNFSVLYDPIANGGNLSISATQIEDGHRRYITLLATAVTGTGNYSFARPNGIASAHYVETPVAPNGCTQLYSDQDVAYRRGYLTIARLDGQARVIAGTFDLQLLEAGCDTIRITQGRFDARF